MSDQSQSEDHDDETDDVTGGIIPPRSPPWGFHHGGRCGTCGWRVRWGCCCPRPPVPRGRANDEAPSVLWSYQALPSVSSIWASSLR